MLFFLRIVKRKVWQNMARWMGLTYRLPSGVQVTVDSYSDWCTLGDLFINGEYDSAIECSLQLYNKDYPFIFLDLGSNVGFFSHRLLHKADLLRISPQNFHGILVEATPYLEIELQNRLSKWKSLGAQLKIIIAAVGHKQGMAHMLSGRSHSRNSLNLNSKSSGWTIPFINLEEIVPSNIKIDLIKCDIEGAEKYFLEEYPNLLQRCKVLVIECHPSECSPQFARERLESLGLVYKGNLRNDPEGVTIWFFNENQK